MRVKLGRGRFSDNLPKAHEHYYDVLDAEEVERRRAERDGGRASGKRSKRSKRSKTTSEK